MPCCWTPSGRASGDLMRRLLMYRLRAKVEIEDRSDELEVAAVLGDDLAARLDLPEQPGAARRPEGWHRADRPAPCPTRRAGGVAARSQRGDARRDRLRGPVACGLRAGAPRARGAGRQSRSGGRPLDPLGERLRGAARRRLQEGLLRRPGADRAHEISRPGAQAPDAGRLRRSAAGARHADPARRQGCGRDALGPGRPRHRAAAPGAGGARGRRAACRCWPMRPR